MLAPVRSTVSGPALVGGRRRRTRRTRARHWLCTPRSSAASRVTGEALRHARYGTVDRSSTFDPSLGAEPRGRSAPSPWVGSLTARTQPARRAGASTGTRSGPARGAATRPSGRPRGRPTASRRHRPAPPRARDPIRAGRRRIHRDNDGPPPVRACQRATASSPRGRGAAPLVRPAACGSRGRPTARRASPRARSSGSPIRRRGSSCRARRAGDRPRRWAPTRPWRPCSSGPRRR